MTTFQAAVGPTQLATAAIVRAARANPNITPEGLEDECERGDIDGWMNIATRYSLTFAQWSGAMERAAEELRRPR